MERIKVEDKREIKGMIDDLIENRRPIHVTIEGEEDPFISKIIHITQEDMFADLDEQPDMIIEKLSPEKGNSLIQSCSKVDLAFSINDSPCGCSVLYKGISSAHPHFGFIVRFPEVLHMEEKRRESRRRYEMPDFVSVEFSLPGGPDKDKVYHLDVVDCSDHGLGLLVTRKDRELKGQLNKGDLLKDITFFAASAMITVDGTVRHMTEVKRDTNKGCLMLGIESPEILQNCKPEGDQDKDA